MPARRSTLAVFAPAVAPDLRSAPAAARRLGFEGLQVPMSFGNVDLTDLSSTGHREVRQVLATQEQQLVAIAADLGPKGFGPGADIDRLLATLTKAMTAARELAAGVVTVDLGPLPQPKADVKPAPKVSPGMAGLIILPGADVIASAASPNPPVPETTDQSFFSQVDAALTELGRVADRMSVMLALRTDLSSFAALDRALRAVGCPWFGVDLDPVALLRDEWDADAVFSRVGPLVRHVRARDALRGTGGRTRPTPIGQGDTVWPELLARLDDAGYHGPITIDPTELPDRPAAAAAALKVVRAAR